MANWYDTPAAAARKAADQARVARPNNVNYSGSANAAERTLGLTSSAPSNGGYQSSNSYSGLPAAPPPVDYQALARQIYEPSLDYLDSQTNAAKKRNSSNDSALAAMFAAGVKDIGGQATGIRNNYQNIIGNVAQGTKDAVGAVDNTYDESANELAAMLQHLGLQQAAPQVLQQGARDEAFFKNMASTSGKSVADMLQANEAGALDFNTAQRNITQQSGLDARANNKLSLEDTLNQIMGQRSTLESQINQQAQGMQQSATDQLLKQMQDAQNQANKDRDYELQQGRLMLDTSKYQTDSANAQQQKPIDPLGMNILVTQLYPDNKTAQGNAMKAITDTIGENKQYLNASDFIHEVLMRNKGANDANKLQQLAAAAYKSVYGK